MTVRFLSGLVLSLAILFTGCSKPIRGGPRETTYPVIGNVSVDGDPTEGVEITCHAEPGSSAIKHPVTTLTDKNGNFSFGTYVAKDGLPEGKYNLTFKWEVIGPGAPINQLPRDYENPLKSKHKIIVADEANDLGTIELSKKRPG